MKQDTSPEWTYKTVEDNGGGLHLYVFQGDRVIYAHSGYEFNRGQLSQDLAALDAGSDPATWDGCDDNPQVSWDDWQRFEYGWEIVADGPALSTYPQRMGIAARLEFGEESAA